MPKNSEVQLISYKTINMASILIYSIIIAVARSQCTKSSDCTDDRFDKCDTISGMCTGKY